MRSRTYSYSVLFLAAFPFLGFGFTTSAVANKVVFMAWGLMSAMIHAGLIRYGWWAGWRRAQFAAALLAAFAATAGSFAGLVAQYHEVLDLGFRAVLPSFYHPVLTRPTPGYGLAALLALAAAVLGLADRIRSRRRRSA